MSNIEEFTKWLPRPGDNLCEDINPDNNSIVCGLARKHNCGHYDPTDSVRWDHHTTYAEKLKEALPPELTYNVAAPGILLFNNVLPWADELIGVLDKLDKWSKLDPDYSSGSSFLMSGKLHQELRPYDEAIELLMCKLLIEYKQYNQFCFANIDTGYAAVKYQLGDYQREHTDSYANWPHSREISTVIALNTHKGGEINFRHFNLSVRLKAGMVLMHPSHAYVHCIEPAGQTNYHLTTWFGYPPEEHQ